MITPDQALTTPSLTNPIVISTDRSPSISPRKNSIPMDLGVTGQSSSSYALVETFQCGVSQVQRVKLVTLWYRANCRGCTTPVLREPSCNAGIATYVGHNDVIYVTKSIVDGFHMIAVGSNFEVIVYSKILF